jgi:hypothetical protein
LTILPGPKVGERLGAPAASARRELAQQRLP